MATDTATTIRTVLADHAKLDVPVAGLGDDDSLYEAGLSSLSTVNVMLAVEDALDIEFPESMLNRRTFESIRALSECAGQLLGA